MIFTILAGATLACQLAVAALGPIVVHERLKAIPSGWALVSEASSDTPISLSIGVMRQNLDQLESRLSAVSTPGNAEYGNFLDATDINALFPPVADVGITSWLQDAGISDVHTSATGNTVNFATTVGTANKLLNTTFKYYQSDGTIKLRTTGYSIPDHLVSAIELISPTTFFGKTSALRAIPSVIRGSSDGVPDYNHSIDSSCQKLTTPSCLKQMYNVNSYTPDPNSGSRIAFSSFLNQSALQSDLMRFENYFKIPLQNFSVELINNGTDDQDPATAQIDEANLDAQYMIGMSNPLPVTELITGGSPPFIPNLDEPTSVNNTNEPYLPYYEYLHSKPNSELPLVISNSYGDDEQTVPFPYAQRVCNMIGLLGLRGVSVLESSGDTGVGAPCQSNDGKKTPQFTPQFPSTCPYITSVGGTQAVTPEIAWFGSSGGFSNYFKQASYQQAAVETYLSDHISEATKQYYSNYTDFSGRAFPDVAAHSLLPNFQVFFDGRLLPSGGTSAACPTFASIVALLNDARLRAGKHSLGFLNPFLYQLGYQGLNDIVSGSSIGCNGMNGQTGQGIPDASIIPYARWNATQGWDPVTGLGTPNFEQLKALVLSF